MLVETCQSPSAAKALTISFAAKDLIKGISALFFVLHFRFLSPYERLKPSSNASEIGIVYMAERYKTSAQVYRKRGGR